MSTKINYLIIFFIGLLVFILPIPHTIALRNSITLLLLIIGVFLLFKYKLYQQYQFPKELKNIGLLFAILTIWILVVAFFVSGETSWSLEEIKGQWLTSMLYFLTFIILAIYSVKNNIAISIYNAIFIALFLHIIYIDIFSIHYYIEHKVLISRIAGLTGGPDNANYITNILLAFIMAEIIYRFKVHKKFLNINNYLLVLLFILVIFSSLVEGMRNGVVAILFLGVTSLFFMLYKNVNYSKKIKYLVAIILTMVLTLPMLYNAKNDTRWSSLIETIPIAIDTENNKYWMSREKYPIPKLKNNENISESNYERVAWGYEGIKLIIDKPFGVGFGRNAFGHGIKDKYGEYPSSMHSHSGIIDLGIGIGVIGIGLWLSIGLYLTYISYNYFVVYHNFFALIVLFNTTGFFARFMVDSNMRDHIFLTFLLILGFSFVYMLNEKKYEKN